MRLFVRFLLLWGGPETLSTGSTAGGWH